MKFGRVHDRDRIERFLRRDSDTHVYALADLDPFFWPNTRWYGASEGEQLHAVCLVLHELSIPIVYALAPDPDTATRELVRQIRDALPARFFANLSVHLLDLFDAQVERRGIFDKMVLREFRAPPAIGARIERLGPNHFDELREFYAGNAYSPEETDRRFLEPYMLEMGPYFGIRERGALVCAGGVHLASERYGVAALGNIATQPSHRSRGLGRAVSAAICSELRHRVHTIGLNVMADNAAAIRCYRSLGFEPCARYFEGTVTRKTAASL